MLANALGCWEAAMGDDLLAVYGAERAIRRLISLYCDAVARLDAEAIGALFASDARVRIADRPERIGRAAIVEGLRATASRFSFLHQKCDTGLIDVAGERARARHSVLEINREHGADSLNFIFGAYDDEYRLTAEGWRFHRRSFTLQTRVVCKAAEVQTFAQLAAQTPFA
jgi:ketosteroid isomerase-like protein